MVWEHPHGQTIHGHDDVVERFRTALTRDKLASSFLFVGPSGIGKRLFAQQLAQSLLCSRAEEVALRPCGECDDCHQVSAGTHPDFSQYGLPKGKSFIPLETLIGERDKRMRSGLCHDLSLKPMRGGRKIAVVNDADFFNEAGANCLLKTLEEPPVGSLLILIGTSLAKQLPTIRSRCQTVRFDALPLDVVEQLLIEQNLPPAEAKELAALSEGSLDRALKLRDPEVRAFRTTLLKQLSSGSLRSGGFPKQLTEFVDAAGKDASPRRDRMRELFGFAAELYRQLMHQQTGGEISGDSALVQAVEHTAERWTQGAEGAISCLERCFEAEAHVFANANQTNLLDSWLDDLDQLTRHGRLKHPSLFPPMYAQ